MGITLPFGSGPGSIAYQALRHAGQLRPGSIAAPEMLSDALLECNLMLDTWDTEQLAQQFIDDRYFNIAVSQQNYTLGPTGTFNTDSSGSPLLYRPQRIVAANLVLLTNSNTPNRIPINVVQVFDYAQIPVLNVPSQVTLTMYVQTTPTNITLYCFPLPTTGNQFEFFMWPGFAQFASLASVFTGNPGDASAIIWNLALRLYTLRDKDTGTPDTVIRRQSTLIRMAAESKRAMERTNALTPDLTPDLITSDSGGQGAPFNYLVGDFSQ